MTHKKLTKDSTGAVWPPACWQWAWDTMKRKLKETYTARDMISFHDNPQNRKYCPYCNKNPKSNEKTK